MTPDPTAAHSSTAAELAARLEAERRGEPFLLYRDEGAHQRIVFLGELERLTIGRAENNIVALAWDQKVSRVHAELGRFGSAWVVQDDGLSSNGTFVNERRIDGRRRLRAGDVLRVGGAAIRFSDPGSKPDLTVPDRVIAAAPPSEAQRRVLVALCRPLAAGEPGATPATNRQIAEELHLSLDAVKTHMRALFEKFAVGDVAQNQKRALLAQRALDSGVVSRREL